ncbi:c-type cytochrome [Bacteroidota bacterium]
MDFPIFHLDFMGDRMLIAVIAVIHVIINHALAVGFLPIVTLMEYRGYRMKKLGNPESEEWDELAYKLMFFAFIVTTSIGALTGVGIWFSAALISPASIGSLIRVFFSVWFFEWIIFVLEVVFIMIYFLSWKRSRENLEKKKNHVRVGAALSLFSWFTMAIIVGILGFMMDTGSWNQNKTLLDGFFNPIYPVQLAFRTPMAFVMGGAAALFLTLYHLKKHSDFRAKVLKNLNLWMFLWTPHVFAAGIFYYYKIPGLMVGNLPVAIGTQAFQNWYDSLLYLLFATIIVSMMVNAWMVIKPKWSSKYLMLITLFVVMFTMGTFERVREFIRKPYVIEDYMYSNQLRVDDYEKFKRDGLLRHSVYVKHGEINDLNKLEAGKDVFMIACSRCHTISGVNSVINKFEDMFTPNGESLDKDKVLQYIPVMEKARYFMPPFPGNDKEAEALTEFIISEQYSRNYLHGAQSSGVDVSLSHLKEIKEGGS